MTTIRSSKATMVPSPAGYGMTTIPAGKTISTTNRALVDFLGTMGMTPDNYSTSTALNPPTWTFNI